jgi:membrane protease YdiL (CAAX protease family)
MREFLRSLHPGVEIALVTTLCVGLFIHNSLQAVSAGFPVPGLTDPAAVSLILTECAAFVLAAAVLRARAWKLADFNLEIGWLHSFLGILVYGASLLVDAAVWDAFGNDAASVEMLRDFAGAIHLSLPVALAVSIVNGAFEEFFLTGYLLKACQRLGGPGAIGISGLIRLSYHLYQGPLGAITALGFGICVTAFYWRYRQLWPVMIAHMTADFFALV